MDSQIDLQQPVTDGGIRSVNFFNGRMLTARDLTREQAANREVDRRLGQAVGDGIAYGFEVSKSDRSTNEAPVVAIDPGLAVNRQGQTLGLRDRTDVALVRKASASGSDLIFNACQPLQSGTYVAGAGVYLLTVAPAETREGRAVTIALNTGAAPCNTDAVVSAVQFRLIQIDPPITTAELQDVNHLRNLIAYKCFGVNETNAFVADSFGADLKEYGLLDELRGNLLTDCDVPLAVLYWTLSDGIKFIDMWSVRRRPARVAEPPTICPRVDDRLLGEGEAMIAQFREQLAAISSSGSNLPAVTATEYFYHLPPAGLIPLEGVAGHSGFNYQKFFAGLTYRKPVFMEGARVEPLLRLATLYPPVRPSSREMIWLYWVRENMQEINKTTSGQPQPYMIFANGHIPFQGEARYDLAYWDYSNYV